MGTSTPVSEVLNDILRFTLPQFAIDLANERTRLLLFAKHFTDPIFSGSHGASSPFVAGHFDIVEGRKLVKNMVWEINIVLI